LAWAYPDGIVRAFQEVEAEPPPIARFPPLVSIRYPEAGPSRITPPPFVASKSLQRITLSLDEVEEIPWVSMDTFLLAFMVMVLSKPATLATGA
jgi:hypothetical protein